MSQNKWDESFLRAVAALQAQISLINAEADELTDLGDMQAQRKLNAELKEYVAAHSASGIIPSDPLQIISERLKVLSEFFSNTRSLQLEIENIGDNLLSEKKFKAYHGTQVKKCKRVLYNLVVYVDNQFVIPRACNSVTCGVRTITKIDR